MANFDLIALKRNCGIEPTELDYQLQSERDKILIDVKYKIQQINKNKPSLWQRIKTNLLK